jgi:putative intracellular protease/amidase
MTSPPIGSLALEGSLQHPHEIQYIFGRRRPECFPSGAPPSRSRRIAVFSTRNTVIGESERQRLSVFILDIMLPGQDGLELCRQIGQIPSLAPTAVIFLTAKSVEADCILGLELGAAVVRAEWLAVNVCAKADKKISDAKIEDYDAVIVIGGAWNPIMLRADGAVKNFIRAAQKQKRLIAAICYGPQPLISSEAFPRGTRATSVADVRIDLANAGFTLFRFSRRVLPSGIAITIMSTSRMGVQMSGVVDRGLQRKIRAGARNPELAICRNPT